MSDNDYTEQSPVSTTMNEHDTKEPTVTDLLHSIMPPKELSQLLGVSLIRSSRLLNHGSKPAESNGHSISPSKKLSKLLQANYWRRFAEVAPTDEIKQAALEEAEVLELQARSAFTECPYCKRPM